VPVATINGIDLTYETTGDPDGRPLLLIMGLGAQLIDWPEGFRAELGARGFHVIAFDNRDAGLSSSLDELGRPDLRAIMAGDPSTAPYRIADLAADAAGLVKELGLDRVHVAGSSLGGMIAQQLTIDHPELVASLCSIMSMPGDLTVGRPTPQAQAVLARPPVGTREEAIAASVAGSKVIGSPGYPVAEEERVRRATAKYDRSYRPLGTLRQYAAILTSPDRTPALGAITAPTLVIHGAADPLIQVDGGRATAAAIPGAELLVVEGMGHDLPQELWPRLADAIAANAGRS
jgi:pimeloyl-ACP methyl ester carboxylesterase